MNKLFSNQTSNVNIVNYMSKPIKYRRKNRRKRKGQIKNQEKNMVFLSCNVSSIKNRLLSLEKVVNDLKLSFFCLQETHVKKEGTIKFENSLKYQIYELTRKNKNGGGLALGVIKELNPFWIKDGGVETEALTVKISIKQLCIRITNAYGPQEYDSEDKKHKFWNYLDFQLIECEKEGTGCMILFDCNAWVGSKILKNDPRRQNKNGALLENFMIRYP